MDPTVRKGTNGRTDGLSFGLLPEDEKVVQESERHNETLKHTV